MMMLSILLIFIPLFIENQVLASPILLWSNANLPEITVSLSTLTPIEVISNYICKLNSEQIDIHLFAVNNLKNEDIQRGSQINHPILINAKKEKSQFRYIPNVGTDNVYQTFSLLPQSNNMQCAHIHFQMASLDTYQTLEDALNAMQTSINGIEINSKATNVMVLLKSPVVDQNLIRQRRDIEVDENDVVISDDGTCMFYADELYWENENETKPLNYSLNTEKSTCTPMSLNGDNANVTSAILELIWEKDTDETINMILIANITGRYWQLTSAKLTTYEYRYFAYGMYSMMDTPPAYSYVCTTATFVKYAKDERGKNVYNFRDKFYITKLQFQPFFVNDTIFGLPNYCTSFFTSGIWMGITSSLLCLGILLFGVYRMMAIKRIDRFDDPKGKPLIIKAQE